MYWREDFRWDRTTNRNAAPSRSPATSQPAQPPRDHDGHLSALIEGQQAYADGDLARAETALRRATSGKWEAAQHAVTVAVAPGVQANLPASTDAAAHTLVEVLQRQGRLDEALGLLETMEPTELVAVSAAELLLEADRPDEVVAAFAESRAVDTPAQQCLNALVAVAADRTGDISGADERLRAVLAVDGLADDIAAEALAVRAALAERAGRDELRQACLRRLARLDPDHPALDTARTALGVSTESLTGLRQRVAELTDLVVKREAELVDQRSRLEAFARRFTDRAGRLMAEVDRLQADLATARAAAAPGDSDARGAAEQARQRAAESEQACSNAAAADDGLDGNAAAPASEELARMWRQAARMMHPDAVTDADEKQVRHEFFVRLEEAYRARDIDHVRDLIDEWNNRPETVEGDTIVATTERLRRTIAQLERQLAQLTAKLDEVTGDPMWTLMLQVEEADETGRDLLAEMGDRLRAQRDELADDLLTLEAL